MTSYPNPHPATDHVHQAAKQLQQANHVSIFRTHPVTNIYEIVGALYDLLTKLSQLIGHLEKSITATSPDTCYHDNGENVATTLGSVATHLANTQTSIEAITSPFSDLNNAHEHLAHIGIKTTS